MNYVPRFSRGDYVRVMQTDHMVYEGLANRQGIVVAVVRTGDVVIESGAQVFQVAPEHVMKMERPRGSQAS